ncbi:hypothetical protein ACWCV9_33600 [Streptomyces sp. NPDC001606]
MHHANGDGIEHFGYADGRSQPPFLTKDLETDFGNYFVLRKLEQNVLAFRQAEEALAHALKLENNDRERAGAMLIGRFKNGTPLTLQATPGAHRPVMNNFNHARDGAADKCPYQAHIRTTNPRGSGGFGQPPEAERRHRRPAVHGIQLRSEQTVPVHVAHLGQQPRLPRAR